MRAILLVISFVLTTAAGAETLRLPPSDPQGKTLPLKGSGGTAKACAAYGAGFTMVGGTCVRISGSARVDIVVGH
ncbi:porin [uncultured Bradyrhizobium sp.]|jgi:hypothetical protein|uniref:porin n=1 Tax=uncultured Bradyrhizobium sp. TaxID=199684 RepID=UPI0026312247|nr:porin [uncultured Bradyrhizobium sp.]